MVTVSDPYHMRLSAATERGTTMRVTNRGLSFTDDESDVESTSEPEFYQVDSTAFPSIGKSRMIVMQRVYTPTIVKIIINFNSLLVITSWYVLN